MTLNDFEWLSPQEKEKVRKIQQWNLMWREMDAMMAHRYVPDPAYHSFYGPCNSEGVPISSLPERPPGRPIKPIPRLRWYGETQEDVNIQSEINWLRDKVTKGLSKEAAVAAALEVSSAEFINKYHEDIFTS